MFLSQKILLIFSFFLSLQTQAAFEPLQSLQGNFINQLGWWGSVQVHEIKKNRAEEIFQELKNRSEFAWDFPADRCYAKAYWTSYLLNQGGVKNFTAWVLAPQGAPLLRVETTNSPKGCTNWVYHVAAGVAVTDSAGTLEGYILDPALSNKPILLWDWVQLMTKHYPIGVFPIVWTSHPFTYRKEDLGNPNSNSLLAQSDFDAPTLERYQKLLSKDRRVVDSPAYQEGLRKLQELISSGKNPAREMPDPCGGTRGTQHSFEFSEQQQSSRTP